MARVVARSGAPAAMGLAALLSASAGVMLRRALLGSARWSVTRLSAVALLVAALFDRVVPSLP